MIVAAVTAQTPEKKNHKPAIATAAGAAIGAASRFILPTKSEVSSIINKDTVDSYISSAALKARGANRSILKFGAIGAVAAFGISVINKALTSKQKEENKPQKVYTKLDTLTDAPVDSCAIMWIG